MHAGTHVCRHARIHRFTQAKHVYKTVHANVCTHKGMHALPSHTSVHACTHKGMHALPSHTSVHACTHKGMHALPSHTSVQACTLACIHIAVTGKPAHARTRVLVVLVAHCQNWSHGSPWKRGEALKKNLGKMTQLAIELPNGRHPLKSPKLWVDLELIPLMGSLHLSKWVRTRCRKGIDGISVSVQGSNCSYPCPQ